jgi:2-keto-4-pentenoate hydratase/2-oxohepta-3-ene-1,7-dioic acid hydratase in catechol pathway
MDSLRGVRPHEAREIAFGSDDAPPAPSKIVAVGRNYREHAAEFGSVAPEDEPMLFLKAPPRSSARAKRSCCRRSRSASTTRASSRS